MLEQTPREVRQAYINAGHETLSLRKQCALLRLNRSTLYYKPCQIEQSVSDTDLLNEIREHWEKRPFYGYRRITWALQSKGLQVNHKRVQRVMALGGIQAIYPGPNTSRRNKQHAVYPYLLRGLEIVKANQVWMVDITYLRMSTGFVYLVALIDVHTRYIVSWSLSTALDTAFCLQALQDGLSRAVPEIINSDQGCQFTSTEWTTALVSQGIQISMTGKGRCLDNVYIERFWRNLKREEFYLNEYQSLRALRKAIADYVDFYNNHRPHQSLGKQTPASLYLNEAPSATDGFDFGALPQTPGYLQTQCKYPNVQSGQR